MTLTPLPAVFIYLFIYLFTKQTNKNRYLNFLALFENAMAQVVEIRSSCQYKGPFILHS